MFEVRIAGPGRPIAKQIVQECWRKARRARGVSASDCQRGKLDEKRPSRARGEELPAQSYSYGALVFEDKRSRAASQAGSEGGECSCFGVCSRVGTTRMLAGSSGSIIVGKSESSNRPSNQLSKRRARCPPGPPGLVAYNLTVGGQGVRLKKGKTFPTRGIRCHWRVPIRARAIALNNSRGLRPLGVVIDWKVIPRDYQRCGQSFSHLFAM